MKIITLPKTLKLKEIIQQDNSFIHVIIGPRQVGKTTAAKQICSLIDLPVMEVSADGELLRSPAWIKIQWDEAIINKVNLLVIDEIQKVENWSETIKELWDNQRSDFKLVLLGSSSLEIHKGLSESLAGRYRLHNFFHWTYLETQKLSPMSLKEFLLYGGYPGSYQLLSNPVEWLDYIKYSIVEPVIGKDILSLAHVKSPALFRQCFELICSYAAQEISYTKLLGFLQNKGNTDLIKHYIELFEAAFLIKSLQKYSGKEIKKRNSSPKLLPLCPALFSITRDADYNQDDFGRAFEILVGSYLNSLPGRLYYWRERNFEVDFIYEFGKSIHAIEVKFGKNRSIKGLEKFLEKFPNAKVHLITPDNFIKLLSGEMFS